MSMLAQTLATQSEQTPNSDLQTILLFSWAGLLVTLALIYVGVDMIPVV